MNVMKKKLNKTGGFTLVEMLIVVAIIAVLIAISIPLISTSLEKARHAVDDANLRDATSLATVFYLTYQDDEDFPTGANTITLYYVINNQKQGQVYDGTIVTAPANSTSVFPACKFDTSNTSCYTASDTLTAATALTLTMDTNGNITTTSWGDSGFHPTD